MSKKLLVVGSNSIHVYNFIALVKDEFDEVLLISNKKDERYEGQIAQVNFHLGLNLFTSVKKIQNIINTFQPTYMHIHQANTYALLSLLASRRYICTKILTAWGSDILLAPKKSFILKEMVKYILKRVDSVTADSNSVLQSAQSLVKKRLDLHNINFGLEVPSCTGEKENIIYSNRLHKDLYNIDKVILSFNAFVQENPKWKLVIAGEGEKTESLKAQVKDLGLDDKIEFIGWVDTHTNYDWYCRAKIYVSIPLSDSVSLSLIEAVLCDCVVFMSDIPANKEHIKSCGFIEKELEYIDFLKYLSIDKQTFAQESQEIRQYFSKELNRQKYLSLYMQDPE